MRIILSCLVLALQGQPFDQYRKADFSQKKGKPDDGWKRRITLEFDIIRAGKPETLRTGLKDTSRDVRAFAATALGTLGDKASAEALGGLAKSDPDALVRGMAVQALGWLKAGAEAIQAAKSDKSGDVQFLARVAEGHLKDATDYAAQVREAYKVGIKIEEMATAHVGKPAPDFAATDSEGRAFKLSDILKKRVVVLTFQLADW
jgi:hypothetical protein